MRKFIFVLSLLFLSNSNAADYYWTVSGQSTLPGRYPSAIAACNAAANIFGSSGVIYRWEGLTARCGSLRPDGSASQMNFYATRNGDSCPPHYTFNSGNGACDIPDPTNCPPGTVSTDGGTKCSTPPLCPEGSYWDFEMERCASPEDDMCPNGSVYDQQLKECVCDGEGVLSNAQGFKLCLPPAKDECNSSSPDFLGYLNQKAVCTGRARCATGYVPGYVGDEAVCIPAPGTKTDDCEGTSGKFNGKDVCIPSFGKDDSCPTGQGGTVNGQHVCKEDPQNDPRCKPGETSGYVGRGSEMTHTCVPANYKPETCPPGQYSLNIKDGFACVYAKPSPDSNPDKTASQGVGGSIVSKDGSGNVTGKQEIELKFPEDGLNVKVPGLLQDQPNDDYYQKLLDHSQTQLGQLDEATSKVLEDFHGDDGAFTERGKLDAAGDYLLGMFGYSTSCSGSLLFYVTKTGYRIQATCEQLERLKRLFGWFIYVTTALGIWGVLMRKQED